MIKKLRHLPGPWESPQCMVDKWTLSGPSPIPLVPVPHSAARLTYVILGVEPWASYKLGKHATHFASFLLSDCSSFWSQGWVELMLPDPLLRKNLGLL